MRVARRRGGGGDKELHVDALIARMRELSRRQGFAVLYVIARAMTGSIRKGLADFGVEFETWFSERSLSEGGAIDRALKRLAGRAGSTGKTARPGFAPPNSATRRTASSCARTA